MLNTNFSPWPNFSQEESEAVSKVLLSNKVNYWTGSETREFEKEFASYVGVKHAVALSNGTVALDLALKALNIGLGDEVVVTPRTFIASVSSIVNSGATPVFADVDFESQNITADTIQRVLTPKTRAVICVHLAGWSCDMDPIMALAQDNDLFVIEDCAQAHGAKYKGRSVGSIGHIGAWSFCQDKIMTTGGEGGMVTTNDSELWNRMWSYKDHGKSYDTIYNELQPKGFRWVHNSFGTNWRMTELQAVIGRIQLQRLPQWSKTRLQYAEQIWDAARATSALRAPELKCLGCDNCDSSTGCNHAAYKCYVFVKNEKRDQYIAEINARGVPCFSGSCSEVYLEKAFEGTGFRPENRLPIAKELGDTSLMFLCHPTMTQEEIALTCKVIKEVCI